MSQYDYKQGQSDAQKGYGAQNLWNAPAQVRQDYNSGFSHAQNNKK